MSAQPDLGFAKRTVKNRPTSGLGPKTSSRNSGPPQAPPSPDAGGGAGGGSSEDAALPNARESCLPRTVKTSLLPLIHAAGEGKGHYARMKVAELKSRLSVRNNSGTLRVSTALFPSTVSVEFPSRACGLSSELVITVSALLQSLHPLPPPPTRPASPLL